MHWLAPYWKRLGAGEKLEFHHPCHPRNLGFKRIYLAEQVGQVEDWALSLSDGSRLHLWLMPGDRWIMHRDKFDPDRGPLEAVLHVMTESSFGRLVLAAAVFVGGGSLVARALRA